MCPTFPLPYVVALLSTQHHHAHYYGTSFQYVAIPRSAAAAAAAAFPWGGEQDEEEERPWYCSNINQRRFFPLIECSFFFLSYCALSHRSTINIPACRFGIRTKYALRTTHYRQYAHTTGTWQYARMYSELVGKLISVAPKRRPHKDFPTLKDRAIGGGPPFQPPYQIQPASVGGAAARLK